MIYSSKKLLSIVLNILNIFKSERFEAKLDGSNQHAIIKHSTLKAKYDLKSYGTYANLQFLFGLCRKIRCKPMLLEYSKLNKNRKKRQSKSFRWTKYPHKEPCFVKMVWGFFSRKFLARNRFFSHKLRDLKTTVRKSVHIYCALIFMNYLQLVYIVLSIRLLIDES